MAARSLRSIGWGLSLLVAATMVMAQQPSSPSASEVMRLGLRGVYFVPNQGQWSDADVHFGLRSRGLDVAFRESSLTMQMSREVDSTSRAREEAVLDVGRDAPLADTRGSSGESAEYEHLTLTITFPGSNAVLPIGGNPQAAKFNYFVGGEGRETASNVPSFGEVIYENLYDGVDLHIIGAACGFATGGAADGVMKYEFHVAPGADYAQIRIAYDGIESLCIDDAGNLQINTAFGTLADAAPIVWQEDLHPLPRLGGGGPGRGSSCDFIEAPANTAAHFSNHPHPDPPPQSRGREPESAPSRQYLPARFELCDAHTYRIVLDGPVDPDRELIIDPDLEWMTYLGGSGFESSSGIAVDSAGNALVTGYTISTDFEGRNNSYHGYTGSDAFVVKVSASGVLQWMTYLGGTGWDEGHGIAVDSAGNALVTGFTTSIDFEGRNNAHHPGLYDDAFVVKVSASGLLQWMTYLGGSDWDYGYGIAVDSAGNALVTGYTTSTDFEARNNAHHGGSHDNDAFVVKVSASGVLQWMTYLGGSDWDRGWGIAVDSAGNALVTGYTISTDFEGRRNAYHAGEDAFVVKISASGVLQWMTYLGGSNNEWGGGLAVDSAGNALVTGSTTSTDFEGRNNASHGGYDAFVVKVSASGALQWMTYLGGSRDDYGDGIAVDSAGNALVTGDTFSYVFEGRNNSHHGGNEDAFALRISDSGQLQWMTYLGGSGRDLGQDIALDSAGNALVTGYTASTAFEGRNNAHHGGAWDAFVVKLRIADGPQLSVTATCPSGGPIQVTWSGATGGGTIVLLYARNTGSFPIPNGNPCAGTQTGLGSNQIQVAYQGSAGPSGSRTLNSTTGPGPCGGYLQLLDVPTCGTSKVVRVE